MDYDKFGDLLQVIETGDANGAEATYRQVQELRSQGTVTSEQMAEAELAFKNRPWNDGDSADDAND